MFLTEQKNTNVLLQFLWAILESTITVESKIDTNFMDELNVGINDLSQTE